MRFARALFWILPGIWFVGAGAMLTLWLGVSLDLHGWAMVGCLAGVGVLLIAIGFLRLTDRL